MEIVWELTGLIVGVLLVSALARRIEVATPILLVPAGFLASLLPFVPSYRVDPELILYIVLPPLLYAAASESSLLAIRKLIRPILGLAVGAVLATTIAVGLVLHWLVSAIPLAAALALGPSSRRRMRLPPSLSPGAPACRAASSPCLRANRSSTTPPRSSC